MNSLRAADPVALVTGTSSGIGRAAALALAQAGYITYAAPLARFREFLETNAKSEDGSAPTLEAVARVIVEAVESEHPDTRYKVGAEAEQLIALRGKLSDREWDALYRPLFNPPR